MAQRFQDALREPFFIEGHDAFAQASIGIVLNTRDYEKPEYIIRDADAAMYHAKEKGRAQFQVFDPTLHERATRLLQIETDLRKAIKNNEFELYYQPIVSLETEQIIGFEALIRWNHPKHGIVLPDAFIPLSEENGLIVPIGRWVLEEACWDLVRWKKHLNEHLPIFMSVNISSKQFLRPSLISEIQEILQETGVLPSELKLEITETALVENTDQTIDLIQRLKRIGIQIVIDDFGTGYSSMSYLQQFPIDTLKVDRSFVSRLKDSSDENNNIVETIIALAHKLKMNVVAEGVETSEQQLVLTGMKCQLAQGYWFSKPLEKEKMMRLVQNIQKLMQENPKASYKLKKLI
jgi:EAL domain-containing protein (putative c-di-GMP-specific phosphodiesterase class I)